MGIKLISGVILTTTLLGAAAAFAHPPSGEMPSHQPPPPLFECGPPPPALPPFLPPALRSQIEDLQDAERDRVFPIMQKLQKTRHGLRKASEKRPFDEAAVTALANEQARLQAELLVAHLRTQSLIHDLLDSERPAKK